MGWFAVAAEWTPDNTAPEYLSMYPITLAHGGGVGWAEKVRFGVESPESKMNGWEALSVRGTIEVPEGVENVVIPKFGGATGDTLEIDLGMSSNGRSVGSCVIG